MSVETSMQDWTNASLKLVELFRCIREKIVGDPKDDVWINFNPIEFEIGLRPEKGVFIGEVREFRAKNDVFDVDEFFARFDELVEQGAVIKKDVALDLEFKRHPRRKTRDLIFNAFDDLPKKDWDAAFLQADASFSNFRVLTFNENLSRDEFFRYPYTIEALKVFEPIRKSEDLFLGYLDFWIYVSKVVAERIAPAIRRERDALSLEERATRTVCLNQGWNSVYFMIDKPSLDFPINCGSLESFFIKESAQTDDIIANAIVTRDVIRRAGLQKTEGWNG